MDLSDESQRICGVAVISGLAMAARQHRRAGGELQALRSPAGVANNDDGAKELTQGTYGHRAGCERRAGGPPIGGKEEIEP